MYAAVSDFNIIYALERKMNILPSNTHFMCVLKLLYVAIDNKIFLLHIDTYLCVQSPASGSTIDIINIRLSLVLYMYSGPWHG